MESTIRKAVIPVAGLAMRLRPITFAVPKALLPIVDREDRAMPVLHYILASAASAGAARAAVIVSPAHEAFVADYLAAVRRPEADGRYPKLPDKIDLILQPEPLGFGHAVLLAADFVDDDPFLLLLGDHLHIAAEGAAPCAAQVTGAFAQTGGQAMVGMQPVEADELPAVGVATGTDKGKGVLLCTDFVEKPDLATARSRLAAPGLPDDRFLGHCGIYAFSPIILQLLGELAAGKAAAGEVELADAQCMLLQRHPHDYYLLQIAGRSYDTGTPAGYVAAQAAVRSGPVEPQAFRS